MYWIDKKVRINFFQIELFRAFTYALWDIYSKIKSLLNMLKNDSDLIIISMLFSGIIKVQS
jgi:hypothetical protein